ncbi:hypothetical protein F5887DRAFT_674775 [Amanita rubescens]|nr:hypothetical protein F5887DRAFT_674775 [Amanita rubescens]
MALKALFGSLFALFIYRAVALDFSNSYWIWYQDTETVPAYAVGDFRHDLTVWPGEPYPVSAEIIITADNNYTLWVNGNVVGQGNNWEMAQEYCVALNPYYNVFAAQVINGPGGAINPAALLAAIEIFYSDGKTKTIVSDSSWRANGASPGFQSLFYDDLFWTHAYKLGTANSAPWHTPSLPDPGSSLSLANSQWIWTNETSGPGGNAPAGNRTFRQDITIPGDVPATGGTIIISTDDEYTLYIDGQQIGTHAGWTVAQRYTFTLGSPTRHIVIAVNAENIGGPAGVIAAVEFNVAIGSCSTYFVYVTDNTWKYDFCVPAGFQDPDYNDCNWPNAVQQGLYGVAPWGKIPTQNS